MQREGRSGLFTVNLSGSHKQEICMPRWILLLTALACLFAIPAAAENLSGNFLAQTVKTSSRIARR